GIVWRKLWTVWSYLWRVKPIEDRFLLPTYYSDPPPLVFLGALLLDDALYAVLLVAGVAGLARVRDRRAWLLCAAWLVCFVGTTLLTHSEGRYRHFVFPVLIPCAALTLDRKNREPNAPTNRKGILQYAPTNSSWFSAIVSIATGALIVLLLYTALS